MGGTAPANQLRLSFTGSEDGEAETETCRAAKPLRRTTTRSSRPGPCGLNLLNRRMRTRPYGGGGGGGRGLLPPSRFRSTGVPPALFPKKLWGARLRDGLTFLRQSSAYRRLHFRNLAALVLIADQRRAAHSLRHERAHIQLGLRLRQIFRGCI